MFQRGTVVQHKVEQWIGVAIEPDNGQYVGVKWFKGRNGGGYTMIEDLAPITGYEFEVALALGDTAKALELYRALETALRPFARFGKLQHRYAPDALFTIAYDRTGKEVVLRYADFIHAAELVPNVAAGQGGEQIGGRGGIAEIMEVKP